MTGPASCGSCTLCCSVMKVAMVPTKPARTACAHCTSEGCEIYSTRPKPCRAFQCFWLFSQGQPYALPEEARPDRCGVVIEANSAGNLIAHSDRPASWMRPEIFPRLVSMAELTVVMIEDGRSTQLLGRDGRLEALEFVGLSPDTNERLYRRTGRAA